MTDAAVTIGFGRPWDKLGSNSFYQLSFLGGLVGDFSIVDHLQVGEIVGVVMLGGKGGTVSWGRMNAGVKGGILLKTAMFLIGGGGGTPLLRF